MKQWLYPPNPNPCDFSKLLQTPSDTDKEIFKHSLRIVMSNASSPRSFIAHKAQVRLYLTIAIKSCACWFGAANDSIQSVDAALVYQKIH
jgi:hypothetical protein